MPDATEESQDQQVTTLKRDLSAAVMKPKVADAVGERKLSGDDAPEGGAYVACAEIANTRPLHSAFGPAPLQAGLLEAVPGQPTENFC